MGPKPFQALPLLQHLCIWNEQEHKWPSNRQFNILYKHYDIVGSFLVCNFPFSVLAEVKGQRGEAWIENLLRMLWRNPQILKLFKCCETDCSEIKSFLSISQNKYTFGLTSCQSMGDLQDIPIYCWGNWGSDDSWSFVNVALVQGLLIASVSPAMVLSQCSCLQLFAIHKNQVDATTHQLGC